MGLIQKYIYVLENTLSATYTVIRNFFLYLNSYINKVIFFFLFYQKNMWGDQNPFNTTWCIQIKS